MDLSELWFVHSIFKKWPQKKTWEQNLKNIAFLHCLPSMTTYISVPTTKYMDPTNSLFHRL